MAADKHGFMLSYVWGGDISSSEGSLLPGKLHCGGGGGGGEGGWGMEEEELLREGSARTGVEKLSGLEPVI